MSNLNQFYVDSMPEEVAQKLTTLYGNHGCYHHYKKPREGIAELFSIHELPREVEQARKKVLVQIGVVFNSPNGIVGIVYSTKENPRQSIVCSQPSHESSSKINIENAIALGLNAHR